MLIFIIIMFSPVHCNIYLQKNNHSFCYNFTYGQLPHTKKFNLVIFNRCFFTILSTLFGRLWCIIKSFFCFHLNWTSLRSIVLITFNEKETNLVHSHEWFTSEPAKYMSIINYSKIWRKVGMTLSLVNI